MLFLVVAALLWIGLHLGVSGTGLRDRIVLRLGDGKFQGLFSLSSVAVLWLLVTAWKQAPVEQLWSVGGGARYGLAAVMLVASILFVGSMTARNPTLVGGAPTLDVQPQGAVQVTRHPMLWGFGLWSLVHMIANGNAAALVFFGAFAITSFAGMPSIDAKMARRDPARWSSFAAQTSIVPFGAAGTGRLHLVFDRGLLLAIVGGLLLWAVLLWAHPALFGVSPLPS